VVLEVVDVWLDILLTQSGFRCGFEHRPHKRSCLYRVLFIWEGAAAGATSTHRLGLDPSAERWSTGISAEGRDAHLGLSDSLAIMCIATLALQGSGEGVTSSWCPGHAWHPCQQVPGCPGYATAAVPSPFTLSLSETVLQQRGLSSAPSKFPPAAAWLRRASLSSSVARGERQEKASCFSEINGSMCSPASRQRQRTAPCAGKARWRRPDAARFLGVFLPLPQAGNALLRAQRSFILMAETFIVLEELVQYNSPLCAAAAPMSHMQSQGKA